MDLARVCRRLLIVVAAACLLAGGGVPASAAPRPKSTRQTIPPAPRVKCAPPAKQRVAQEPWAQAALAPERAWNLSDGGGVLVAVVGTGIDASVPQLSGRVRPGVSVALGGHGEPADTDCTGTGTFAAGIVAARRTDGVGFAGVAPGASLLPVRVARPGEDPTPAGVADGIDAAVAGRAKVIVVATKPVAGSTTLARAVRNALASDVLIVAPAGEARDGDARTYFPAAYPGVIAVASTDMDGSAADRSDTPTGVRVDLGGPGKDLLSLGTRGPGLLVGSGNEYAAAFVAGAAALVRAYYPKLTAAEVTRRLESSATRPGTAVPDPYVGWGVVNPYEAVGAIMPRGRDGAVAPRVRLPQRVVAHHEADRSALLIIGGTGVAVVLIGIVGAVVVAGRRRGWQAG
jgi:membrane-anchored mycosin MYCP